MPLRLRKVPGLSRCRRGCSQGPGAGKRRQWRRCRQWQSPRDETPAHRAHTARDAQQEGPPSPVERERQDGASPWHYATHATQHCRRLVLTARVCVCPQEKRALLQLRKDELKRQRRLSLTSASLPGNPCLDVRHGPSLRGGMECDLRRSGRVFLKRNAARGADFLRRLELLRRRTRKPAAPCT